VLYDGTEVHTAAQIRGDARRLSKALVSPTFMPGDGRQPVQITMRATTAAMRTRCDDENHVIVTVRPTPHLPAAPCLFFFSLPRVFACYVVLLLQCRQDKQFAICLAQPDAGAMDGRREEDTPSDSSPQAQKGRRQARQRGVYTLSCVRCYGRGVAAQAANAGSEEGRRWRAAPWVESPATPLPRLPDHPSPRVRVSMPTFRRGTTGRRDGFYMQL